MANPSLARRTSSVAYDDKSHGPKYVANVGDAWRKRMNLPPFLLDCSTSLSSTSLPSSEECSRNPMFSFGILTDIQYAPIPDGHSYNGAPRYYRHAITAAEHAARHFEEQKVHCVLNLGDIIDGKCVDVEKYGGLAELNDSASVGHQAVDDVLKALSCYTNGRIIHTYGNHELYNLSREQLGEKLQIPFALESTGDLVGYYDHQLNSNNHIKSKSKLRFIVLDSYDICILDRCPKKSDKHRLAREILSANNPNYPQNENSPEGLEGMSKRFVAFNGAIDLPQLTWFEQSLQSAKESGERVIVCSHQPIHPGSSWPTCLVWNYQDVLTIMRRYSDVIIASFAGHAHRGGYVRDEQSGIHFRTLEAVLESPDPIRTYGIVDVWEDRIVLNGCGDCASDVYDLDHLRFGYGVVHELDEEFELNAKIG